ncbi:MAG: hypothetical protein KJ060_07660 [Candidatus Hydrogenedentes bacterium]|nr:hypothetical protein [Candidatus Hydrogenedentota bacterium]
MPVRVPLAFLGGHGISCRSQGHGDALFDWLTTKAREENCATLELESGTHRHDAHRFYLRKRMRISSYHFTVDL